MKTFNVESELQAIGGICDGTDEIRATLLAALAEGHFASETTNELFVRLGSFQHQNRPIPNLKTLRLDPALSDDARDLLDTPYEPVESTDAATALIDQLELYRKLRVIYNGSRDVIDSIREPSPKTVQKAIDALEGIIMGARSQFESAALVTAGRGENAESVINQVLDQSKPDRIITGFKKFDDASGGFARTDLVLMAATTSGGKSIMANQLAVNAYLHQNRNVALVSFEMDEEEIYSRILSSLTEIPFEKIYLRRLGYRQVLRCRRAWETFTEHGKRNGCRFSIWCPAFEVTPAQVGAMLKPGCFDEVLIDYVGLVNTDQQAALWENLGNITRAFKTMARNQNNVVIVMAQLDEETNKVKYSKAMRHHSSYVWKWKYGEEEEETNEVIVNLEKARHCRCFKMELFANFSVMSFNDKCGSETSRQTIDRLSGEYGVFAVDPQTGEVTELEQEEPAAPVCSSCQQEPCSCRTEVIEQKEPPKPVAFTAGNLTYASMLDEQLRSIQLPADDEI